MNREIYRITREGQSQESAERDPDCYHLHCPGCHAEISEAHRVQMLRRGIVQKSTLPPEEAAKKEWIGVHTSQLYTPSKTVRAIAKEWIATDCGRDENTARVFFNKVLGECFEHKVKEVSLDALRSLRVIQRRQNDPEFYLRGQVPPWVLFLTAGQDSRSTELHHAIWGWGVRECIDGTRALCGALIEWGEIKRRYSLTFNVTEYHVYDDLIYNQRFACSMIADRAYRVRGCGHDIGWQPTQIPVIRYCRRFKGRAMPCKGASEEVSSASDAPYIRMGAAKRFKAGEAEVFDDPALIMNTFILKTDWFGWVDQRIEIADKTPEGHIIGTRKVPLLSLPADVDDLWLEQSKNEKLGKNDKGEMVWQKSGPNHLSDCNTYAYAVALQYDPHAKNKTAEEYGQMRRQQQQRRQASPPASIRDRRANYEGTGGITRRES